MDRRNANHSQLTGWVDRNDGFFRFDLPDIAEWDRLLRQLDLNDARAERQALAGVLVDRGQHSNPAAFSQQLCHEIHAPSLVDGAGLAQGDSEPLRSLLSCASAHDHSFLDAEVVNALCVHVPTFPFQHDGQSAVPISNPAAGELPQSHSQCILRIAMMLLAESRPVHRNQPRGVPLA